MNRLTWPTDCTVNIQWVGQGEGLLADKSSAALNKQTNHLNWLLFHVETVEMFTLDSTQYCTYTTMKPHKRTLFSNSKCVKL